MRKLYTIALIVVIVSLALTGSALAKGGKGTPDPSAVPGGPAPARNGEQSGESVQSGPCGPACRASWPVDGGSESVEPAGSGKVYRVFMPVVFGGLERSGPGQNIPTCE